MNQPNANIVCLFEGAAAKYPQHVAIIYKDQKIRYSELYAEVQQTAFYFQQKGIKKGDRVLVFVPMSIDLYRIVLALFYIGATAVFLDEWVSKKRLDLCCNIADCNGFVGVFKARLFGLFSEEIRRIPIKLHPRKKAHEAVVIPEQMQNSDPALITFTTGSTGTPKAANRTHGFLKEQFNALVLEINPAPKDVDLPTLPIVLFMNLGIGCTSVIAEYKIKKPKSISPSYFVNLIEKNQITRLIASPFLVKIIANHLVKSQILLKSLNKIFTGGAAVFPHEASLFTQAFSSAIVTVAYGSTEAEPISSITAQELVLKTRRIKNGVAAGMPFSKAKVRIIALIDELPHKINEKELQKLEVESGQIGEIIVSGPHVLGSYYNNEDAFKKNKIITEEALWHRTGDSGFIQEGELFLTGRCQQVIKRNDDLILPFVIEMSLSEIDGVESGTILLQNEKLKLVVESDLPQEQIRNRVQNFQFDDLIVLKNIPKDPRHFSKIDYEKLKVLIS